MPRPEQTSGQADGPRLDASMIFGVLGVLAFVAGVTKAFVLEPLGDAFGDLSPDAKTLVTALVVAAVVGGIAAARWRHRRAVMVGRRVVEGATGSR